MRFAAHLVAVAALLAVHGVSLKLPTRHRRCTLAQHVHAGLRQRSHHHESLAAADDVATDPSCMSGQRSGIDFVSLISVKTSKTDHAGGPIRAVWVKGYPRSGTSTTLSMISSSAEGLADYTQPMGNSTPVSLLDAGSNWWWSRMEQNIIEKENRNMLRLNSKLTAGSLSRTFALFEPCHDGDMFDSWLQERGCGALLRGISVCNFTGVQDLWGWNNPHTTNNDERKFDQTKATELCAKSDLVAFKTVHDRHPIKYWKWLLDDKPHMYVLDVVRDPRGIWSSWKTTPAFEEEMASGAFGKLSDICKLFASNIAFKDDRVHTVVFEHLVHQPEAVARSVYKFLGLPFLEDQQNWVRSTFNAKECPPHMPWFENYTDCHTNSGTVSEKWRSVLSWKEKQEFAHSKECRLVAEEYGYPMV